MHREIKVKAFKGFYWSAYSDTVGRPAFLAYMYKDGGNYKDGFFMRVRRVCTDDDEYQVYIPSREKPFRVRMPSNDAALRRAEQIFPFVDCFFGVENEKRYYKAQDRLSPSQRS